MSEAARRQIIEENLAQPSEAQVDGVRARQHSLADQLAAHRALKSEEAAANPSSVGFKIVRIVPPGAV